MGSTRHPKFRVTCSVPPRIRLTEKAAMELLLTTTPTNPVATKAEWAGHTRT